MDRLGRPLAGAAPNALVILAHQDDETGILTRIRHDVTCGIGVWCVFLTDGAKSTSAAVRDRESLSVLTRFGVPEGRVIFLRDDAGRIADGQLMSNLLRARALLESRIAETGVRFSQLYTIDWEGGHADHDACHLLALALARDFDIPDVWAFSLYNAYRAPRGFFRVLSFVPAAQPVARRRLSAREAIAAAAAIFAYASQRRTWLALGPGWIAKTLLRREERLRRADPARVARRPHDGPLLYETLFKEDAAKMLAASAELRRELSQPPQKARTPSPP